MDQSLLDELRGESLLRNACAATNSTQDDSRAPHNWFLSLAQPFAELTKLQFKFGPAWRHTLVKLVCIGVAAIEAFDRNKTLEDAIRKGLGHD